MDWTPDCEEGLRQNIIFCHNDLCFWDKISHFVTIITVGDYFCTAQHDLSDSFMGWPSGNVWVCRFYHGALSVSNVLGFAKINYIDSMFFQVKYWRGMESGNWHLSGKLRVDTTSYIVKDLVPNVPYAFQVWTRINISSSCFNFALTHKN